MFVTVPSEIFQKRAVLGPEIALQAHKPSILGRIFSFATWWVSPGTHLQRKQIIKRYCFPMPSFQLSQRSTVISQFMP